MDIRLCVFGLILAATLSGLAPLAHAQMPPADALVIGGLKLGDTKPMVLEAAKKLGLVLLKEGTYDTNTLAYQDFAVKDYLIRDKNSLIVQFSPVSQKVVGIGRFVYFDQPLPRTNVYKATVERFGRPQFHIGANELTMVQSGSLNFGFDTNGIWVKGVRCNVVELPIFRSSNDCGLGITVRNFSGNENIYWAGQGINIFDFKTMYKELTEIQDSKDQAQSNKLKAAGSLAVPRL